MDNLKSCCGVTLVSNSCDEDKWPAAIYMSLSAQRQCLSWQKGNVCLGVETMSLLPQRQCLSFHEDDVSPATGKMSLLPQRQCLSCHRDNASLARGAMSLLPQRQNLFFAPETMSLYSHRGNVSLATEANFPVIGKLAPDELGKS